MEDLKLENSGPPKASTEVLADAVYSYYCCGLDCHHNRRCNDQYWCCEIAGCLWAAGYDDMNKLSSQHYSYCGCGQLIGAVEDELKKRGFIPKCQRALLLLDGKDERLADIIISEDGSDFILAGGFKEYLSHQLSILKIYESAN